MTTKIINILGTEYTIKIIENKEEIDDKISFLRKNWGYTRYHIKTIYIDGSPSVNEYEDSDLYCERRIKETLRHEIIHAFLLESGLSTSACTIDEAWVENDEMIDWFAMQLPKIYKVFKELDILD